MEECPLERINVVCGNPKKLKKKKKAEIHWQKVAECFTSPAPFFYVHASFKSAEFFQPYLCRLILLPLLSTWFLPAISP